MMPEKPTNTERDLFKLDKKVAVVTGGGRGLGLAMAQALSAYGAHVVIAGRNESTLAEARKSFADPARVSCRAADVSREDSVAGLAKWVTEECGGADILVNNAGINPYYKAADQTTLPEWQEVIGVNLTGVFLCCRAFGAQMLTRGKGSIVSITSVAGHLGLSKAAAYCAAKAAWK